MLNNTQIEMLKSLRNGNVHHLDYGEEQGYLYMGVMPAYITAIPFAAVDKNERELKFICRLMGAKRPDIDHPEFSPLDDKLIEVMEQYAPLDQWEKHSHVISHAPYMGESFS